ncbi:hypothetical protein K438DRAFT_1006605 [Mycena galopus ATCC 62051]|nr:hypothetical protein K438DRAFT_1006605 [Mycena galopus ATCC 62051]
MNKRRRTRGIEGLYSLILAFIFILLDVHLCLPLSFSQCIPCASICGHRPGPSPWRTHTRRPSSGMVPRRGAGPGCPRDSTDVDVDPARTRTADTARLVGCADARCCSTRRRKDSTRVGATAAPSTVPPRFRDRVGRDGS